LLAEVNDDVRGFIRGVNHDRSIIPFLTSSTALSCWRTPYATPVTTCTADQASVAKKGRQAFVLQPSMPWPRIIG
jgi:hypothetical protein